MTVQCRTIHLSLQSKPKREVIAKDERSKTDKNRERRLKKIVQKKKQKFQEEKDRKKAERDPRFRERLERKQARENLKNSTNTKVLKTVRLLPVVFIHIPSHWFLLMSRCKFSGNRAFHSILFN